jgi:hypothetical protein
MKHPNYYVVGVQSAHVDVKDLTNVELKANYFAARNTYAFLRGCYDSDELDFYHPIIGMFAELEQIVQKFVDEANRRGLNPAEWKSDWFSLNHPNADDVNKHKKQREVKTYAKGKEGESN